MSANNHISVGLIQMNCQLANKVANLDRAERMLEDLAGQVQIACLPEMFNTGYNLEGLSESIFDLAETIPGETTARLGALAKELDLAIVASLVERDLNVMGMIFDSVVLLNREGELVGRYRKSHLFPPERRYFCPGDELPVF